jgi:hypothetical protein
VAEDAKKEIAELQTELGVEAVAEPSAAESASEGVEIAEAGVEAEPSESMAMGEGETNE